MEQFLHILIPLGLIAAWVINSLMNKEVTPPQARLPQPRPGGGLPPAPRPVSRPPTLRFPPTDQPPTRRPYEEEVVVVSDESGRPVRPQPRPGQGRRQGRAKPAPQGTPRKVDPGPDRALGGRVSQTVSQTIEHPLDVLPLSQAQAISTGSASGQVTAAVGPGAGITSIPSGADIRRLLASSRSIREALIVNELLQPPIALRPRR